MTETEEKKRMLDVRKSIKSYAYTPGLKVKRSIKISKERKLPIPGEVLTSLGEKVNHDTIVAKVLLRGDAYIIKGANELKVDHEDVKDYLVKSPGDHIKKGEILLHYSAFFGLIKRDVLSPVEGIVESVSDISGQIILRGSQKQLNLEAYIPGEVVEILPGEGIVVETRAGLIQGIFGIGGEAHGRLKLVVNSSDETLTEDEITNSESGCILVGGSDVTLEALRRAKELGVSGIITGGIEPDVLKELIGEEIGVAITGQEEIGFTLIVTEGFGRMSMSKRTMNLLRSFDGYMSHINGATQIRAGVMRPEIIIPHEESDKEISTQELSEGMVEGTLVRVIRQPYFGEIGTIVNLPIELMKVESGSLVRVIEVELEDEVRVIVPRANVEIIEE